MGLPCSVLEATSQEGSAFLPVTVLAACLHQAGRQPVTYLLVRACQSVWLYQLDDIYQRFAFANPLTQPSASSGIRLPESRLDPHGFGVPRGGYIVSALSTRSLPISHRT